MKTPTICTALLLLSFSTSQAQEPGATELRVRPVISLASFDRSHFVGDIGLTPTRIKSEDFVLGLAASASRTWGSWRGELEYAWRYRTDLNGYLYYDDRELRIRSNVANQTLSANLFRYFQASERFQAYATAGVGVVLSRSVADMSDDLNPEIVEENSHSEQHLTWNAGVGMTFDISRAWAVDVGYRYVHLSQATTPTFSNGLALSSGDVSGHEIALSLIRSFGGQ